MKRAAIVLLMLWLLCFPVLASAPLADASLPLARLNGRALNLTILPEEADSVLDLDSTAAPVVLSSGMPAVLSLSPDGNTHSLVFCSVELWQMTESGPALKNGFAFYPERGFFTFPNLDDGLYGITLWKNMSNLTYAPDPQQRQGFLLRVGDGETQKLEDTAPLPPYFPDIMEPYSQAYTLLDASLTRNDLGVTVRLDSMPADDTEINAMNCVALLKNLDLVPWRADAPPLAVEKPFTISLTFGKRTDLFHFTSAGISAGGVLYTARHPEVLASFYEADAYECILTANIFTMEPLLDFGPEDVAYLEASFGGGGAFSDTVVMKDYQTTAKILDRLKKQTLRCYIEREGMLDLLFTGSSSYGVNCHFHLKNGQVRSLWYCANRYAFELPNIPEMTAGIGKDSGTISAIYALDEQAKSLVTLPQMRSIVNGQSNDGIPKKFDWNGVFLEELDSRKNSISIAEDETARCTFSFTDQLGHPLIPEKVQVEMSRRLIGWGKPNLTMTIEAADGSVSLPATPGSYDLFVTAAFPEGYVGYSITYTVSDINERLFDFAYNNCDVSIRYDDGRCVTQLENSEFRSLLIALNLSPDIHTALPVKEPFILSYDDGDQELSFAFTKHGVEVEGRLYGVASLEALKRLEEEIP